MEHKIGRSTYPRQEINALRHLKLFGKNKKENERKAKSLERIEQGRRCDGSLQSKLKMKRREREETKTEQKK